MTTSGSPPYFLFFLLLLLLSFLSPLFYFGFWKQHLLSPWRRADVSRRNLSVLLWRWPFRRSYRLDGDRCLQMFNISRCHLTDDVAAFPAADVVVFHHQELSGASSLQLHRARPPGQRWVWMSMEPPVNNANLSQLNGFFNWTMSYRRDADVPIPYGRTEPGGDERGVPALSNRSCLVGWVVSRYRPDQARAAVYQRLKEHIPIEVYGRWSGRPLSARQLLPTIAKCLFYLSFENSQAEDYISEKLWRNAYRAGAVPVVLGPGRAAYEAVAPPHSFIHVADFKSTADLAAHLKRVAADGPAYQRYFAWRRTHRVTTSTDWRERLCQICVRYRSLPGRKVYRDLESWVNR
ncbi:alpha-(1,3)-fucosyltransferase 7 isoform X2 [Brachyistius frenatus]